MDVDNSSGNNTEEIHFDEEKVKLVLIFHELIFFSTLSNPMLV